MEKVLENTKAVFIVDRFSEWARVQTPNIPIIFALLGPLLLVSIKLVSQGDGLISDGAAMMLALAFYLIAAVFYLTDLYAPLLLANKVGLWAATLGVFWNLTSWLLRWMAAYDRELEIFLGQGISADEMPWIFRYVPFANLYDLSLAFAFGAGVTTLLVLRLRHFQAVAVLSLPLAAIILVLARFIGGEFIDLPPVLDSYWRPIHVGIASMSYGVALVCFAVAVLYLMKDGTKIETMAVWTSLFALAVFGTIGKFGVFSFHTFGTYSASTFVGDSRFSLGLRADLPYVGWMMVIAGFLLLTSIIAFIIYLSRYSERSRAIGWLAITSAMIVQAICIGMLVYQLKMVENVSSLIDNSKLPEFAIWMLQQQNVPQQQIDQIGAQQLYDIGNNWLTENASQLRLSLSANPVELAALVTGFAGTFFVFVFGFKAESIRATLPSTETLDSLMYKLGGFAFAGLALLLITGAVWANESWGRYWGWDAKEVGALVAWLTYAGFLHSRIAYGWKGRRSACFAIIAFLFVIFTYLGVSYLLPGLHSYA